MEEHHTPSLDTPQSPAQALRWLLHEHRDETEAALAIIERITSSLDVGEVLDESVRLAVAVARCQGAVIYILDEEAQRLWVRAASAGYEQWIDQFSLEVGAGLTGWTALNRVPAMISENPQEDPRYRLVPELNDPEFQSALTYPMISPGGRLVGVITLHTEAPREFTDEDLILVAPIASLSAAAVERAQLFAQSQRQIDVLRSVGKVGDGLASPASSRRALRMLCESARLLFSSEAVVIYERRGRLWRLVASLSSGASPPEPDISSEFVAVLASNLEVQHVEAIDHRGLFTAVMPGDDRCSSGLAAPLRAGGEAVGLMVTLGRTRLSATGRELLGVIATVAAMMIQGGRLVEHLAERNIELAFLEALREEREPIGVVAARARQLGVDLDEPHVAAAFELAHEGEGKADPDQVLRALGQELLELSPGSVFALRSNQLMALIRVRSDSVLSGVQDALENTEQCTGQRLNGGLSGITKRLGDHPRAFAEAVDAMRIGGVNEGPGHVIHYDELGGLRHLWTLARSSARDPFQERIDVLRTYDDEHGSQLLDTLGSYLDEHANHERASARLRIHRNTLRQRIQRIQEISGVDLEDKSIHFDLIMALGIVRFRRLQNDAAGGDSDR